MLFRDMKCFVCGNPPEKDSLPQGEKLGLTIFDAAGDGMLEIESCESYHIRICNSCLAEGGRQGRVCRTITERRPSNYYEYIWNPDGDDRPYRYPPPVFRPCNPAEESSGE